MIYAMYDLYTKFSRQTWLLAFSVFLASVASIFFIYLPIYLLSNLAFTVDKVGLILSVAGIGFLLGIYFSNYLRFSLSPISFYKWATFFITFIYSLFYYFHRESLIFIFVFIAGILNGAARPILFSILAKLMPDPDQSNNIALLYQMLNLGLAAGAFFGGIISTISYHWLFLFCAMMSLASLIIQFYINPQITDVTNETATKQKPLPNINNKHLFYLYIFFIGICLSLLTNMYPIYLKEIYKVSKFELGVILSINSLLIGLMELPLINFIREKRFLYGLKLPILLISVGYFILPFYQGYHYALITIFLITIGEMAAIPIIISYAYNSNKPHEHIKALIRANAILFLPMILTPYFGSNIYTKLGPQYLWYIIGFMGFCIFISLILDADK